ncbi:hypothetical protein LCGC14_2218760 [marine sediment metagenome]|uniref:DUF58 domain-containing protein n=1 Tax=marine sediment metagenome TaxID=412755 RepID=A0A0F9G758_9ZZZZ
MARDHSKPPPKATPLEALQQVQPSPPPAEARASGADAPAGLNRKYLRVNDLRRLRNLFFSGRRVVEGQYAGRHASPMRGHSVEFSDYRVYMPGDEIADVDWKIYGRSDKLFIKLFEHQSDMTVSLLVDGSASMAYAGLDGEYSKYDHACMMAAAVAFLTTRQQDKVSFGLSQNGLVQFHRPHRSFGHLMGILDAMENTSLGGKAGLPDALRKMASQIGHRGLLIVFSDLLDDPQGIFKGLSVFTHRGSEVILFHILHADELSLPDVHESVFVDSETLGRVSMNVEDIRPAYEKKLSRFIHTWSSACRGRGIDYKLISTATHYREALEDYLFQRASMA